MGVKGRVRSTALSGVAIAASVTTVTAIAAPAQAHQDRLTLMAAIATSNVKESSVTAALGAVGLG